MSAGADRWIRWTTTGCVGLLALIAGTVSYLYRHPAGGVARAAGVGGGADAAVGGRDDRGGIDDAASRLMRRAAWREAALGASCRRQRGEPGRQRRGGPPTAAGRVITALPSFALIGAYELLMRQVRHGAAGGGKSRWERRPRQLSAQGTSDSVAPRLRRYACGTGRRGGGPGAGGSAGQDLQRQAWHRALAQRAGNGGDGWSNAGWKSRQECRRSGCCRWHASLYTA